MTVGTKDAGHNLRNLIPNPVGLCLPETAFQVVDNPFKFGVIGTGAVLFLTDHMDSLTIGAVEDRVLLGTGQLFPGGIQREAVMFAKCFIIHLGNRPRIADIPSRRLDRAAFDGQRLIRDNQCRVNLHKGSETSTFRAGTLRVVERKHPRLQLPDRNPMLRASIRLGKGDILPRHIGDHQPVRQ